MRHLENPDYRAVLPYSSDGLRTVATFLDDIIFCKQLGGVQFDGFMQYKPHHNIVFVNFGYGDVIRDDEASGFTVHRNTFRTRRSTRSHPRHDLLSMDADQGKFYPRRNLADFIGHYLTKGYRSIRLSFRLPPNHDESTPKEPSAGLLLDYSMNIEFDPRYKPSGEIVVFAKGDKLADFMRKLMRSDLVQSYWDKYGFVVDKRPIYIKLLEVSLHGAARPVESGRDIASFVKGLIRPSDLDEI